MAQNENVGAKFSIDITALRAGLNQANKLIRASEAEFREAASGMDDWKNSEEGLLAQQKHLNTQIVEQKKKIASLTSEKKKLVDQMKAEGKSTEEIAAATDEINKLINRETKALDSARDALEKNEKAMESLGDETKKTGKQTEKASEGFTIMKGALASLAADAIKSAISAFKDLALEADKAYSTLQAQTGLSAQEMKKFESAMSELYASNYGESMEDIAESMGLVAKSTRETDPSKVKELTKNAIALRDTFGYDINESIRSVKALMTNFGISGEEAFNLIVQGAQNGLDYSDEMIDSINEYSVQFAKLGLNADDMFNIFAEGAKSGAWNLDKVGDAVKEFSIRAIDGSKTTTDAYKQLGLNADEMMQTFTKGGDEASAAFRTVVNQLIAVDDKVKRDAIGVELFGTMWEDLGVEAVASLATTNKSIDKTSSAMQKLDAQKYANVTDEISALGRSFKTKLSDSIKKNALPAVRDFLNQLKKDKSVDKFADSLIKIGNKVIPPVSKAVKFLAENIDTVAAVTLTAITVTKTFAAAMAISNTVTATTTAIKGLTAGVGLATKAQTVWNTVMSANPIGAVLTAVGLLAGGIALLVSSQDDAAESTDLLSESQREAVAAAEESAEAYKETKAAAEELAGSELANIEHTQTLWKELQTLADENGKVKEGYEGRAQFILNELNNALGTEYEMNGNIIQSYEDISASIDEVIEKKKAQILLEAYEDSYRQAVEDVAEAEKARATQAQELVLAQEKVQSATAELTEAQEAYDRVVEVGSMNEIISARNRLLEAEKNFDKEKGILSEKETEYDESEAALYQYYKDISDYETASTLVLEGETAKAIGYLNNLGSGFETVASTAKLSADEQKKVLEQQVIDTEVNAQLMKSAYEQGVEGVTEEMVKTAREQADKAKEEFLSVGGNITKGIADGAEGEERTKWTLSGAMSRLIKGAVNAAKKAAGIESPSKLFKKEIGRFLGLGVAAGVDDSTKDVVKSVKAQVNAIKDAYDVPRMSQSLRVNASVGTPSAARQQSSGGGVTVYQTNNYSQAHSRYELYKSKQQTAAAVRLAMGTV